MAHHQAESQFPGTQAGAALDRIHAAQDIVADAVTKPDPRFVTERVLVEVGAAIVHALTDQRHREAQEQGRKARAGAYLESARLQLEQAEAAPCAATTFVGRAVEDMIGAIAQLGQIPLAPADVLAEAAHRAIADALGRDEG